MVKVLVVDDSALMRSVLKDILGSDPNITIVGNAKDGEEAIQKVKELSPDVVTMDIEMPRLDGISALKRIMKEHPIPVVMISAHSKAGSEKTIEAMDAGAVDFILKPSMGLIDSMKHDIIFKVKVAALAKVHSFKPKKTKHLSFYSTRKKIIVIASSTGGPQTVEALLVQLPQNLPCPILIVQHMPAGFTEAFAKRLNAICEIEVREAKDGDPLAPGVALIAPGGYHMELVAKVEGTEGNIRLNQDPPELGVRPNANVLFRSVVKIFGKNTIGVVLTGMGCDGTDGCKEIKAVNGTVIAQSEKTSIIYGMPKEVAKAGYVDEVLDLEKIPELLVQLAGV